MAQWLKHGALSDQRKATDAKVRQTVEQILEDIGKRGEAAVREYSQKFDNWAPKNQVCSDADT
jgi:sulfopropanediol 3-dehydrogenase